jgi:predicted Zn-dependent peptidase
VELIQEIFLHSTFPEKEREKEAEVILNEIQSYDDSPSELIFDRAEELLFPGHSIGRNILGSEESLKRLRNGALERFREENYATDEIVLSFVGSVPFSHVKLAAEKYFGDLPLKSRSRPRKVPEVATSLKIRESRDTTQKHVMLVGQGFSLPDSRRLQLYLLNNILGGPGMNSRLNMALRERRGYSYSAESHYAPYTDTGALMVYFSCDPDKYGKSMQVAREELRKLRTKRIPETRLRHAKKQMIGQLAISRENNEHLMLTAAKSCLVFDRVFSLEEIYLQLEAISPEQMRETAIEVLDPSFLNLLIFE